MWEQPANAALRWTLDSKAPRSHRAARIARFRREESQWDETPRQSAVQHEMQHRHHFRLVGLTRNLQKQRFRHDPLLDTLLTEGVRNIAERKRLRHRGARPPNLPRDVFMCVLKLRSEPMQPVRFFKRRQILALNILDQSDLERLRIVRSLLDARDFAQSRRARRVIAPLP